MGQAFRDLQGTGRLRPIPEAVAIEIRHSWRPDPTPLRVRVGSN